MKAPMLITHVECYCPTCRAARAPAWQRLFHVAKRTAVTVSAYLFWGALCYGLGWLLTALGTWAFHFVVTS